MKNMWTILALTASIFFLSHCGSDPEVPKNVGEEDQGLDPKISQCLSGVYSGRDDIRYDWIYEDQTLDVSIAFLGNNALVQVSGDDGDVLCTHYAGVKTQTDENGVTVLSANEIVSKRTEGTHWLGSDNVPQSFGNITLTFPKQEAETAQPEQNAEAQAVAAEAAADGRTVLASTATAAAAAAATTEADPAGQNPEAEAAKQKERCSFKISSFEKLESTPEEDTIESKNLKKDLSQAVDYNALLTACGGKEGLKTFTTKLLQEQDDGGDSEAEESTQEADNANSQQA